MNDLIVAVAVCPHPPLLVPAIAAGAAAETDELRAACDQAITRLVAASPERVVVVGGADAANSGLRGLAPGLPGLPDDDLPLSLAIGDWLLDRARVSVARELVGVRPDGTPSLAWPTWSARTGLLVMADGSARRDRKGPGYFDERAAPFDVAVVKALAEADVETLAHLDADLCEQLLVGGVGAWKALAQVAAGRRWVAEILYDDAPYGVQYTVASWLPA